jgi:hypothetical protein
MPRVILHVGPHKTASTALQDGLQRYSFNLRREGIEVALASRILPGQYGGLKSGANLGLHLQGRRHSKELWRSFLAFVADARRRRHDIVLTTEELDQGPLGFPGRDPPRATNISMLMGALKGFRPTVVAGHRPFYEWAVSVHSEVFWPDIRGGRLNQRVPYVPLASWLTAARIRELAADGGFFTTAVARRYAAHGISDVRVREASDTLLKDFICEDLRANTTCTLLQADAKMAGGSAGGMSGGSASEKGDGWPRHAKSSKMRQMELALLHPSWRRIPRAANASSRAPTTEYVQIPAAAGFVRRRACLGRDRLEMLWNLTLYLERRMPPLNVRGAEPPTVPWVSRVYSVASALGLHSGLTSALGLHGAAWFGHFRGLSPRQRFDDAVARGAFCSEVQQRAAIAKGHT